MRRLLTAAVAAVVLPAAAAVGLLTAHPAAAATLTRVTGFGTNPSNLNMYLYVPATVSTRPALLVAVHYCTGSASAFFNGGAREYVTAADQYGYLILFPEATRSGQCFDVWSPQGLKRDGGSDSTGIMSMVNHTKQKYNVDPARVVVTGASSGAMMTNVLAAEYPDVFAAGAAFSGVPATCFATGSASNTWNSQCSGGQITKTAQQWGDAARAMYPGYTGRYPRMQLWHGATDSTLSYVNYGEEIKQWTNLNGVSQTPTSTDYPQSAWTRTRYGGSGTQATVEGISIANTGHTLPQTGMIAYAIAFLGLNQTGSTTAPPSSAGPSSAGPSSAGPSPSRSISDQPSAGGCRVTSTISAWNTGLTANLTITNTGSSAINGWNLVFTLPAGQTITSGWNATYSPGSGQVTATSVSYNGAISSGGSTSIGFQATHTGNAAAPAGFTLNGTTCQTA
ncbi:MAG: PHB depolymerase family esterase [Micromonosporaceae bacterium]|nr:PHB depolymerase family esterase [Micromonosporaceae bacterium]